MFSIELCGETKLGSSLSKTSDILCDSTTVP